MDKKSAHKGTNVMPTATMVTSCQWCLFLKFPVSPLLSAANHNRDSLRKECTQLHTPMQSDVPFAYFALVANASNCMFPQRASYCRSCALRLSLDGPSSF